MSEDVDFKLVLKKDVAEYSKNELNHKLSEVKHILKDKLISLNYISLADTESTANSIIKAHDSNQYIVFNIPYQNKFPSSTVLRPHIQIELNYTKLQLPMKLYQVGYIYKDLIKNTDIKFQVRCVSIEEAFCEKLIAFPRRYSHAIANNNLDNFDQALVRHLYDVHQIKHKYPVIDKNETLITGLIKTLIQNDAIEFSNQHQQFIADPIGELNKAMESALTSQTIRKNYNDFLEHMVYQDNAKKPTFEAAINTFQIALNNAIKHIPKIQVEIPIKQVIKPNKIKTLKL